MNPPALAANLKKAFSATLQPEKASAAHLRWVALALSLLDLEDEMFYNFQIASP